MKSKRLERVPAKYRKEVESQIRTLARTLREQREHRGLTQEKLAEQLDISVRTLQFIEQGRRFPSLPMLFYILRVLDVELRIK